MTYTVAVRALCEFTAKQGDLDLRFTPSPTAQEGIEGHAAVRSRRGPAYLSEISLAGQYRNLQVRGRADGYDPASNRLEEIKTYRGSLHSMPDNHRALHWAQAKIYGHLLCVEHGLADLNIALVYYDIIARKETDLSETCTAQALEIHFRTLCERFIDWADQELAHRGERDLALQGMTFPYPSFRTGQRQLAETVYKAVCQERHLLAQAPTGIGKTLGALFPALKACPREKLDKVFFLTAKTSGRQLALDALKQVGSLPSTEGNTALRVLELTAREKACEHPDKACHGDACPLAKGFYDRLPQARSAAVQAQWLDKKALRDIALAHQVCPYWLAQDLAKWADVVIGDYNYFFDGSALLYNLAVANQWQVCVLADEAHNLLERARKMYSANLNETDLREVRRTSPPALKRGLNALLKCWLDSYADQEQPFQSYPAPPVKLVNGLMRTSGQITEYLAEHPLLVSPSLQAFHFDVLHFLRLTEVFGPHSSFDITLSLPKAGHASVSQLNIRNMIPAPFLAPRFSASRCSVLFSATLSPWTFYRDTLGLPENTAWIDVESPFRAEQLKLRIATRISTRYSHRAQSLTPIAERMAGQYTERPGNYLSYFSSFDYLQQAAQTFAAMYPDIPIWVQSRSMQEADKEAFLARFNETGQGIGFAVLGGVFGEGIDLPGRRLIGAFISTLGLPQVSPVNEQLKRSMETVFGRQTGYDYAYLYPGIQKVVQAAGRVIRTDTDQGVVHLLDDRYAQPRIQALFPRWWQVEYEHN